MSDELKGRGQVGELIAQVFELYEKEKLAEEKVLDALVGKKASLATRELKDQDPYIQT